MKRLLLTICAVAAAVCSCSKYGETIDELNRRLDSVDATQTQLLSRVEAMEVLANAKAAQITITSISNTDEGLKIAFSDNKQYIIVDGVDGKKGEDGKPGKNGENKIVVTEDAISYTFNFGDGTVISVLKTFCITLESDSFEAPAGSDLAIKYEIAGGDGTEKVVAKDIDGCKIIGVDQEARTINVKASGRKGDHMISVMAIRNSDGKVSEKYLTITSGPRAPIALEGSMAGDYADNLGNGTNNYYTQFWKGEIDENNYFVGEAYSLLFDFFGPASDVFSNIPAGTYVPAQEDGLIEFTYKIGTEQTLYDELVESFWIYQMFYGYNTIEELIADLGYTNEELYTPTYSAGAELYHQLSDEEGDYEDLAITEGTVNFALNGSTYTVTMDLVAGGEDWTFTYEGEIEMEDHRPKPAALSAYVYNYGDDLAANTTDWYIEISDVNHPEQGVYYITLLGPANGTELPVGTFEVKDDLSVNSVVAGEDYTWYSRSGICWDQADEGTLTIEKTGDSYSLYADFIDTYYSEHWIVEYEGTLNLITNSLSGAPAKDGRRTPELGNRRPQVKPSPALMRETVNAFKAKKLKGGKTPWISHR